MSKVKINYPSGQNDRIKFYLVVPQRFVLPSNQIFLHIMEFVPDLAREFLMQCRRLLREARHEHFRDDVFNVPLDQRGQVGRQYVRKVSRDVHPQEKFLNLNGETL